MSENKRRSKKLRSPRRRFGAVTVEAAIMTPILVIISLGSIDIAQYINVSQTVCNASREGTRCATRDMTDTVNQVTEVIHSYIQDAFPHIAEAEIQQAINLQISHENGDEILDDDLSALESGTPIRVQVHFNFSTVRWFPGLDYFNGDINESISIGRRE